MNLQLLYQDDPTVLEFEATCLELLNLPDGRRGVVLDRTYFYPTGGGQEHDTGRLGAARVVDVLKDENHPRVVHIIEGDLGIGPVMAHIDAERRLRHMQHHTAQHLLTQCILRQTGFETVSANINGYSPSTLDVIATQIDKTDLEKAEAQANQIIYDNLLVKTYFVTPQELASIPLRRPPKVTENIRIVEIDEFDYSPCGGTHTRSTGSIGLIKVIKAERQNDKLRVSFVAGLQAMEMFTQMYDVMSSLANKMSTGWQDIPVVMTRLSDQLTSTQKELQELRKNSLADEARNLVLAADEQNGLKVVRMSYKSRPVAELRVLAEEIKQLKGVVAYLCSYDGQKLSLVVTCGEGSGSDARQLLNSLLSRINGRGGGDAKLAQGGGVASEAQFLTFLD